MFKLTVYPANGTVGHTFEYDNRSTYESYTVYYNTTTKERLTVFQTGVVLKEDNIPSISS